MGSSAVLRVARLSAAMQLAMHLAAMRSDTRVARSDAARSDVFAVRCSALMLAAASQYLLQQQEKLAPLTLTR